MPFYTDLELSTLLSPLYILPHLILIMALNNSLMWALIISVSEMKNLRLGIFEVFTHALWGLPWWLRS